VQRGSSPGAAVAGGMVGALLYSAFGSFNCKKCGKIPHEEFSREDRNKMILGSVALIVTAIVLLFAVIVVIVLLRR
jgi:hypothetical protein